MTDLDKWFNRPTEPIRPERETRIREAAKAFADEVATLTPRGREQDEALMLTRHALHIALAGITTHE